MNEIDELARKVADAAVAARIAWNAKQRVGAFRLEMERAAFSYDFAMYLLGVGEAAARQELDDAVREYRASVEAAAIMEQPAVRRGLEGVGEMEGEDASRD